MSYQMTWYILAHMPYFRRPTEQNLLLQALATEQQLMKCS